ncbi:polysaccharide pyruvyl transferase family protein [Bacteroides gallinaceum]|uniref:polysaccharide pyruvyl transferase family protein n=1 Tax=Bacteroides gallinaceum TaxID=1462571 RepID=UPI0025A389E3|nr:polysaccharide pyruvyl transferase family protein [Bacteroides gallinaceum]MDM8154894.1 polysaccharide pyruvyl transferase family protein [Bacteroides gallinaceum]
MKYYFPIHLNGDNRGCEAIAKGTALILKENKKNLIGLCTNTELDHRLKVDDYITLQPMCKKSILFRAENKIYKSIIHDAWKRKSFIYHYEYTPFLNQMTKDDIMISTGGDTMCYDENQVIYTVDYLHKRGIHSILWGCSIGEKNLTPRKLQALKQFSHIYARETLTQEVLANHNINNVSVFPDPAFVLEPTPCQLPKCFSRNEVIGINLSNYVMGGFDLNSAFAKEVDSLIKFILQSTDYQILLIPHVLWKGQDDRIISNLIKGKYDLNNRINILDSDNLNYCQIRYIISKCYCFIGARTHAAISAYSTCIPTIAIGYSIKSKGIAKDIGMPEEIIVDSINIRKNQLLDAFCHLLNEADSLSKHLHNIMDSYKQRCKNAIGIIDKL